MMATDLAHSAAVHLPALQAIDLYRAVLSGRKATTVLAYEGDYRDFAAFLGVDGPGEALEYLVGLKPGLANATALGYRGHLVERGLSSATIARRLSALKSAIRLAKQLGRVDWTLEVEAPKVQSFRDTTGPGRDGWQLVLAHARKHADRPRGRRDLALIRLLYDLGLRRAEAVGLDLAHVDLQRGHVQVLGKGRTQRETLTLPAPTRAALADWIAARGSDPGPLFPRLDRAKGQDGGRLTGRAVLKLVGAMGRAAGLSRPLRPHGLRHAAITRALEVTNGDVTRARKFSRHKRVETLLIYDDRRTNEGGRIAEQVAED
jgi:integrase/recombinase XerC